MGRSELRIQAIGIEVKKTLANAAKNRGETRAEFLRPKIREIIDSFPEELKKPKTTVGISELKISGISDELVDQIKNISDHLGISPNQLIRMKLIEASNQIPEWMKSDPPGSV